MRKIFFLLCIILCAATSQAQLTGTKTIPGTYPDLASAITDLNTQGVGAGGVVFNLLAGNPQTAPAGGYSITTITGTAANQITLQGNGNTITASGALVAGNLNDAIFKLIGADYVTLTGFTMQENAANTTTAAATNNMTEWGVALLHASTTDGCQNNTIQANTISLDRTYSNSFGIYSNNRHSATVVTVIEDVTNNTTAPNSGNKIYANNISNVSHGILFIGAGTAATAANMDNNNDIGGASPATGNSITNYGSVGSATAFVGYPLIVAGAYLNGQLNNNLSYNSFISANLSTLTAAGGLRGILVDYATPPPAGAIINNLTNNTVTFTHSGTGSLQGITTGGVANNVTVNMNNNKFINNAITGAASAVTMFGIANLGAYGTININNSTISGNTSTGTTGGFVGITNQGAVVNTVNILNNDVGTEASGAVTFSSASTGSMQGISNTAGAATATININGNFFRGFTFVSSGQFAGIINQAALVAVAVNMNNNHLGTPTSKLLSYSAASSGNFFGIVNAAGAAASTLSITGNDITRIEQNVTGTGGLNYINNQVFTGSVNISNNTFTNITANSTATTTLLSNNVTHAASTTQNINNNSIVTGFNRISASGALQFYLSNSTSPVTVQEINNGNNFSNITIAGTSTIAGWQSSDGSTTAPFGSSKTVTNNTFSNITGATGTITLLNVSYSNSGSTTNNVSGNTISNVTGGAAITGITCPTGAENIFSNTVNTLSSTGSSAVTGLLIGGNATQNAYKNKIYNLSSGNTGSTVNGISITGGTTVTVNNNLIGDLRAPAASGADVIRGISITSTTVTSNLYIYYNTINLNAISTGANFGTSGLFHTFSTTATTATLNLRNNIIVNNSTPNGTGLTVAFRRSSSTNLNNYGATSNNNLFFAGAPCASRLIFYDGTNADQTLAAYKVRVAARDAASVTEDPQFLSITGSSPSFLHINPAIGTVCESGAATIAGFADDFDGDVRTATPDIGADEFSGTAPVACAGTPTAGTVTPPSSSICAGQAAILCLSGQSIGSGISIQWQSASISGGPYTSIPCAGSTCYNTGVLPAGTYYFVALVTCSNTGLSSTSNQVTVVVNAPPTIAVSPASPSICTGGTGVLLTASGAATYTWSPATGLSATTGTSVTANPLITTIYTVTGIDANGCSNTTTVTVTVNQSPTITSIGSSSPVICGGGSVDLTSSAISNVTGTLLTEGFEGGVLPAGWASVNAGTGNLWAVVTPTSGAPRTGTKCAEYNWNTTQAATAYLITSGMNLTGGTTYTISSWYRNSGATFPEKLRITVGNAQTAAAQTTILQDIGTVTSTTYLPQSITFTPGVSGTYYFGWNCYSAMDEFYLEVDDISITGPAPAPTYSWTSNPAGFTSALQNPTGVTPAVTTIYTLTASNPNGCSVSSNVTVAVNDPDVIATPSSQTICSGNVITPIVLTSTSVGTTFTWTRDNPGVTGTIGNSGSGDISGTLINSTAAPITVTFTLTPTNGVCVGTGTYTATVTVNPSPSATISYAGSPYCTFGTTATVTQTGTPGGVYSSTGGLSLNPATGEVTLGTSTPGSYTVTYTIAASGPCPQFTTTATIDINVCAITCIEDFNSVTVPALPAGWLATSGIINGSSLAWATVNTTSSSAPNSVFTNNPTTVSDEYLDSRVYTIAPTPTQLVFSNNYNLEYEMSSATIGYDGMVLEISINGGAFTDIITAGGSFVAGGYNKTISSGFSSPIGGRQAWSANSGGFITTKVTLPAAALGQNVVFRWRRATDSSIGLTGANIDDVYVIGTATIAYAGTPYCSNAGTANVTFAGTPGGTYSSTAGLSINSSTGAVNLGASTPGSYTVTYSIQETSGCPVFTTTAAIDIAAAPAATISYAGNPYCQNAGTATVTQTGTAGGSYSSTAGLIINAATGDVNLAASTAGTYTVTYTIAASGPCALFTTTTSITITAVPAATISYAGSPYCSNAGTANVTFAGTTGGTYSSTAGLSLNASTGAITLGTSTPGTYTVTYTIAAAGGCALFSTTASVTITAAPAATISYAGSPYCLTGGTANVTRTGTAGGTYSSTAGLSLNASTGAVTLGTSTPGTYTVTYTIAAAGGCALFSTTASITINPTPNAIATPSSQTVCSGSPITAIALTGAVGGTTYNWTRNNTATVTGIAANGSGNISGTLTNTTNAPITVTFTITPTAAGCTGTPINATVLVNPTPVVSQGGMQVIITGSNGDFADEITWTLTNSLGAVVLSGGPYGLNPPATPSAIVPATNAPFSFFIEAQGAFNDNSCLWEVRCDGNVVASGCIRGVNSTSTCPSIATSTVGNISGCGSNLGAQTICSGSAITPINLSGTVAGTTFSWTRNNTVAVTGIAANGTGNISGTLTNTTSAPVVVTFTITPSANGCNGTPVNVNVTVNPIPNAVATPSSQTVCSGVPITTIALTSAVSGTTYSWTRNNTVTVTGIAANGTGNISGTLTNTTVSPVTVTFTITPTANGCTGAPITATVIVNSTPIITCPAPITATSVLGSCSVVVNYSPTITGTPAPTITYSLTGATTGSGSGTGSGLAYNVGVTTVVLTATSVCGVSTCSFTITVNDSQLPVISVQPANRTVCAGSNAVFSVTASNVLGYQWQQWNGTAWVNVTGATASTMTVSNTTVGQNTSTFRVVLTGLCTVVNSNAGTLFVNPVPSVIISANPPASILPNQTTTLSATVNPAGGTYAWYLNGTAIPGATASSLGPLTINDLGIYKVLYTSAAGCPATSADFEVTGAVSNDLWVYPNPNNGQFQVRFFNHANEPATIRVLNAAGQKVYEKKVVTGNTTYTQLDVDLGFKANGIYIVQVVNGEGKILAAKRIIVQVQ